MPPDGGFGRARASFYEVLTRAVRDLTEHGFDSVERLTAWVAELRRAAEATLTPPHVLEAALRQTLGDTYRRLVDRGGLLKYHPGVSRFTLERLAPRLRPKLDQRIMMSAQLIRLNRDDAIEKTLRRFSGWASSIPAGGSKVQDKVDVKSDVRKGLAQLPFVERRVLIDQGHKLVSAINQTVAEGEGALAATWRSHWRQAGYNFREDHKERDGLVYTIRGNWAIERGLMKPGKAGYLDEIDQPAEKPFCRCFVTYLYTLRALPPEMLTVEGVDELARVREELRRRANGG